MKPFKLGVMLLACSLSAAVWAGDTGVALKNEELKAEPFSDAKTVAKLASGSKVEILLKDGGWLKVKSGKSSGWVRMLSIRRGEQRASSSSAGLMELASGRSGKGKVVASTGVRGLNEEELKAAKYDEAAVQQAESYAVTAQQAQQFAAQGKLAARPMAYLP